MRVGAKQFGTQTISIRHLSKHWASEKSFKDVKMRKQMVVCDLLLTGRKYFIIILGPMVCYVCFNY